MRKATVVGHRSVMPQVIEALQRAGALEVTATESGVPTLEIAPENADRLRVEEYHADAVFTRDFLARFHTSHAPLSTFISEKVHVSPQHFYALRFDGHARRVYRECVDIADRLASGERERVRLNTLLRDLTPWLSSRLQIGQWKGTERTVLFTGTVPALEAHDIRAKLREVVSEVTVEELGSGGERQAWIVIAAHDRGAEVRALLASISFTEVLFPSLQDYPAEEAEKVRDRLVELQSSEKRLIERAGDLAAKHYHDAVALAQALESARKAIDVHRDIGGTQRAFIITGWVAENLIPAVQTALEPYTGSVDLSMEEPGADDEPPVALDNPAWLKPFEMLTDLYGRPTYRGIDPTPLFAPFFLFFFALCVGDVGYGALLILGAWFVKHRLDVASGVKRFMDLVMMGGAASMVVGVFLASYIALPVDSLPAPLRALQVLDPLVDIQQFLVAALVIGLVQVFFGVFIATYSAFKRGDAQSAVFDQLSIVFLFVMLGVTAVAGLAGEQGAVRASLVLGIMGAMVMQGRAVQAALRSQGVASWDRMLGMVWVAVFVGGVLTFAISGSMPAVWMILGVSAVGLFAASSVRRGVVGVLTGAYNVYGLTGFVGDVLSYLRLPALGLSGTLVGGVFNILAGLVWSGAAPLFSQGGFGWIWGAVVAILAVAVFTAGHAFNVVIMLLGAFVHPTRLQFVEFFSKFYKAGGRPFAPFGYRTDGLVLDVGIAGEEGGRVS